MHAVTVELSQPHATPYVLMTNAEKSTTPDMLVFQDCGMGLGKSPCTLLAREQFRLR